MSTRRWVVVAVTLAASAFVAVQFFGATAEGFARTRAAACLALHPDPLPEIVNGKATPDFELTDGEGRKISLRSQIGHPVMLNFWATWCPPCTEEMPSMEAMATSLEGTDMRMLAVSVDEDWAVVKRFFARGTHLGVLLDPSRDVPKRFGTVQFPETFFIDAQGRIRHYFINKRDWSRPEAIACLESLR